jgi:SNF2 family DNA or RNA helicase
VTKSQKHLNGFTIVDYSNANKDAIDKFISPLMLHYTQEEAGFDCPVNEHFIEVEDSIIPAMIKKLFKIRVIITEKGLIVADSPAKLMSKMHQISSGTCILDNDERLIFSRKKADEIKKQFEGKRIAIFYKFIAELDVLKETFGERMTEIAEEFQENPSLVFLSQIQSGREGIALHFADALIYYSIDYSAVSYWQSRARIQSFDRKKTAEIYWVFTKGGIEKKIYKAVSDKKDFTLSYFLKSGWLHE